MNGSLFLKSYSRGQATNLLSGSANTEIEGSNCLLLKLHTGSYSQYFTGSQYTEAGILKDGVYSATFALDRNVSTHAGYSTALSSHINALSLIHI